ncbi:gluconate 2-dehydrogenase subunit 3 family protein [Halioxenophilus aromaticivorans]|uniref:Lactose 3-dehydrogenase subunit gamma LacC n=1 Tax=Halioxenophilus aromaticivorans TaxID=1306992 RepID=A0AAV3U426_9ALTE
MHRREMLKHSFMLVGFAAAGGVAQSLMAGGPLNRGLSAVVFNQSQEKSVAIVSEMIIPTTDTPGAIKAGVPDFISTIVSQWYNDEERAVFFQGFKALDEFCQETEQKDFADASEATRIAALTAQETATEEYKKANPGAGGHPLAQKTDPNMPFFGKLKELVVTGYYTSEVGAKQELSYMPMPGYYDGSYEYAKVGRRFTS